MSLRLQTPRDLRLAGQAFAEEAADAFGKAVLTCPQAERSEAYVAALAALTLRAVNDMAADYERRGIPPLWVARFRTAATRTLFGRLGRMSAAAKANGTKH